eukprot:10264246-Alexandrium_andersonii.AAC.1
MQPWSNRNPKDPRTRRMPGVNRRRAPMKAGSPKDPRDPKQPKTPQIPRVPKACKRRAPMTLCIMGTPRILALLGSPGPV